MGRRFVSTSQVITRALNPVRVDLVLSVAGVGGSWWNATSQPHRDLNALAVSALAVLMGTVAWRRRNPIVTTIVAALALIVFVVVSGYNGDGTFEAAAISFNFYLLGQRSRSTPNIAGCVACFASWLTCAYVITYDPSSAGSLAGVAGTWAVFGPLPFICGFLLAVRSELTVQLESRSVQLDSQHKLRSERAAGEERRPNGS